MSAFTSKTTTNAMLIRCKYFWKFWYKIRSLLISIVDFFWPKKLFGHMHINHAIVQLILSTTVWRNKLLVPNSKDALTLKQNDMCNTVRKLFKVNICFFTLILMHITLKAVYCLECILTWFNEIIQWSNWS